MWYPTDNESVSSYGSCRSGVSSNSSEKSYVTSPYSVVDLVTDKMCEVDVSLDEASSSSEFSEDESYVVDSGDTASIIDSTNAVLEFSQIDRLTCHNGEDMEQLQNSEKFCLKSSPKGCCKRMSNTVRSVANVTYDLDAKFSRILHELIVMDQLLVRPLRSVSDALMVKVVIELHLFILVGRFDYVRAPPVLTAIHVPEAHNLPRYTPEGNKQDFMRWSDSAGELVLYKVRDVASSLTSAPLGCTYDSALDTFVFTLDDSVITSCPYPYPDNVLFAVDRRPCFADSVGNQMFFTDLRANTLTCMEFTGNRLEKVYSRRKQLLPVNNSTTELERFMFMSGIRCDGSGHLLIADARARTLKNKDLRPVLISAALLVSTRREVTILVTLGSKAPERMETSLLLSPGASNALWLLDITMSVYHRIPDEKLNLIIQCPLFGIVFWIHIRMVAVVLIGTVEYSS
uniref:DUF295 domain-containing protein n=1 Tax=Angiostrongylus cantonensis TaxID=6313 RepID=A0A158P780_ANGCA